ncbi:MULTISPECIES: presqualene diphosphate synthase HpnD [Streptomyces]|uniref:Phytoene synthase n=1 Tax=Streptomyces xiamenensis TaxID=408015 RepID=A0A0F7CQH7_9ACTN|nr:MULTISPECIES: presqualene diphosphate synthase HpnD [Streptomyces]AKG46431.1 Phytoene synthase [Streptomyces xiamenensis]MCU4746046.1 presqualene diphosphate synthase HpnD [Streptomyces sp. G-5]QQN76377.1 presqualene diphosphate synthase HpnD [Streptomyces sp. XC 2026]
MRHRPPLPSAVLASYHYCETITGQQARNFAYGIRLLPTAQRRALSALYAFARRVDDIGDGTLDPETKRTRLLECRDLLERVRSGSVPDDATDPVALALAHAARTFPIPLGGLDELIDGVLMDVRGHTYENWDDLRFYCRCVAGAIGRLSLGVFGTVPGVRGAARAPEYADTLGLALQLTNILRDVREDAGNGRVYLPAEDLRKFACPETAEDLRRYPPPHGADFTNLVRFQIERARELFAEGFKLLPMLDRRSGACVAAMAGIYHRLLDRIAEDPAAVLRGRVALPAPEKALVAVRGLTGMDARRIARQAHP